MVVLEGQSQVFVCSLSSQKHAFETKEMLVKRGDALQVQEYEENQKYS